MIPALTSLIAISQIIDMGSVRLSAKVAVRDVVKKQPLCGKEEQKVNKQDSQRFDNDPGLVHSFIAQL